MSYVAGFKHDIFVSYAHFDNEEDSQAIRWVSRFQADLKSALRQRLGVDPEIFFDTRDFGAHSHVDFLLENVRQSAAFLAVFSPSYVTRDFTIRELEAFAVRTAAVDQIVTVELLPVEENRCHPHLRGRKRTPLWWKDASEQDIPLQLTPKFNPKMYHARVQILAHQLKKMLEEIRARDPSGTDGRKELEAQLPPVDRSPPRKPVLLAQVTDDLYDERESVHAYFEQFGINILPENDYPQGGIDFAAAALERDLARADLFVQMLGNFGSRKPFDLTQSYSQFQYDAAKRHGLKIMQWRRPDLDLAAVTHRDRLLLEGPDVLAIGLEEFKSEVLRSFMEQSKPEPPRSGDCHFFINADRSDKELADALLRLFEGKKNWTAARPLFEGSAKEIMEDLEANLINCGALLLLYGNAPPAWVRAQLLRCSKLEKMREEPLRLKTIVLGPPAPKAEIAWSGSFDKLDCQDGSIEQHVRSILDGLRL
jgi:hypothetical protein